MGAAGSVMDQTDAEQFAIFVDLKSVYEEKYSDKIKSGELSEDDAFMELKTKAEEIVQEKQNKLMRAKSRSSNFSVGDVVRTADGIEGVVIQLHHIDDHVTVDDGNKIHEIFEKNISKVMNGETIEVNDMVEIKESADSFVYYQGIVISIDADGKLNVKLDGDDDDYENGVDLSLARKVNTGRPLACMRWKKAMRGVQAMRAFKFGFKRRTSMRDVVEAHADDHNDDEDEDEGNDDANFGEGGVRVAVKLAKLAGFRPDLSHDTLSHDGGDDDDEQAK